MAKISQIMTTDVPKIDKNADISAAAKLIAGKPYGCVVVVDGTKPIGIITESDILKNLVQNKGKISADKIMSSPITTLSSGTKLEKAGKITDTKHCRRYPIVVNGNLVGLVTENSIVQAINDNIRFHRNLQNAIVVIFVVFEFFVFVLYKQLINFFA